MSRRRIIITGGGTGIGRATAARFVAEDPELVLVGRREQPLLDTAEHLRALRDGVRVSTHSCDLTDPVAVGALADDLLAGPPIHVIVANAGGNYGVGADHDLGSVAAAWRADFDGNVLSAVLLTHALLPHLARPGGRIVGMSSIAALRGSGSYGAAKAAIDAWILSLAGELARDGITANAVAPGFVPDTEFWAERIAADPSVAESRLAPIPMGRAGTPDEVAAAVAYLASAEAGWTTGQILQVNGGTLFGRG